MYLHRVLVPLFSILTFITLVTGVESNATPDHERSLGLITNDNLERSLRDDATEHSQGRPIITNNLVGSSVSLHPNITAMEQLRRINTLEAFMDILRLDDGQAFNVTDFITSYDNETGKFLVSEGGGRIADPDDCSPRLSTVRLNVTSPDPKIVFFPQCTKMERCGGCCSSPNLECVPSYTERVSLKVFKAEVPSTDATQFVYKGFQTVIAERHLMCRIQCTLDETKCGPQKLFLRNQCMCKCRQDLRCDSPRAWDPEVCSCVCAIKKECCPSGQQCGLIFDPVKCDCAINNNVMRASSGANITAEQHQNYWSTYGNNTSNAMNDLETQTASPTSTTTSTTLPPTITTVPLPVPDDPCARHSCPGNMIKVVVLPANICGCRMRPRTGRPRRSIARVLQPRYMQRV
ncbi:balbiani ring protein 3 [Biomphalaria glabrata]|nr:balbiani ring protein 3 [Biomphalaria glabrata]